MLMNPVRIVLVDQHLVLTESLASYINSSPNLQVVGVASDAESAMEIILEKRPEVVVFDTDLPGRSPFDASSEIYSKRLPTRVLFLTSHFSNVFVDQALRVHARGYLLKSEPSTYVVQCLERVAAGETCFSRPIQDRLEYDPQRRIYKLDPGNQLTSLTSRQLEVLRYLARGSSVKEVARKMHLSEKSVDSHKYRIMHKLNIHDRVELALYAVREGLTTP